MAGDSQSSIRALIVAEHASAKFGGEAFIPFQYFKHLRQLNIDVHLLVHERTGKELREAFPDDRERIHFVADSRINICCHRLGQFMPDRLALFTLGAISHFDTQLRQRKMARTLVSKYCLNLVHEPIPVSPKQPSMMFGLGVPVIIGPMNGGMDYPPNYDQSGVLERAVVGVLRRLSSITNVLMPGKRRASLLLVANKRTYDALPFSANHRAVLEFVENGVDTARFNARGRQSDESPVTLAFVGRLVDWKRVDLLLMACARLKDRIAYRLLIVGDGPLRNALEQQARQQCGLGSVEFLGWRAQAEIAAILQNCDMMALPSMRESGGAVVLEAMASGIPVIAAKWGGPVDYLTEDTGILIPPQTPEDFVTNLARAIEHLASHPETRLKMGRAARTRAEDLYDWRVKTRKLIDIYRSVLGHQENSRDDNG